MTSGINRFIFHRFAHQPWVDDRLQPGMALGAVGMNFDRTNTWWKPGRAWMQYLARCQYLLQSGLFVADIVYLTDEEPQRGSPPVLKVPRGMGFDMASSEAVLTRMQVRDGRIVLPDAMSYRYLVLQSGGRMTPELMAKVAELIKAGATVIGTPPVWSPSLQNYPACDQKLQATVTELWGENPGPGGERRVGSGRVIWGKTLEQIMAADGLFPDFACDDNSVLPLLHYLHRRIGDTEAYFVALGGDGRDLTCTFRVNGKVPEIWHPETGAIETASSWEVVDGRTRVNLRFPSSGSVFVMFREPAKTAGPGLQTVSLDGRQVYPQVGGYTGGSGEAPPCIELGAADRTVILLARKGGEYQVERNKTRGVVRVAQPPAPVTLSGPCKVRFLSGRGAPKEASFERLISWSDHSDPGIKYYSGTAAYEMAFELPGERLQSQFHHFLDLGKIEVIAEVKLNGQDLGVIWTPPYRLDVTRLLQPGRNTLEVQVTNLWVNRMVGDEQFLLDYECPRTIASWPAWLTDPSKRPEPQRMTFSTFRPFTKETPLMPSGLLGPVKIETLRILDIPR